MNLNPRTLLSLSESCAFLRVFTFSLIQFILHSILHIFLQSFPFPSYENRTKIALNLFTYNTIASSVIFTIFTGWDKNYQWLLLIVCLLIFFSVDENSKYKINHMEIILISLVVVSVISHLVNFQKKGSDLSNIFFSMVTALY